MTNNNECYIKIPIDCSNNAPNIGENGNWYIGDTDTGIKAQGKDGEPGEKGDPGEVGPAGGIANMDVLFEGEIMDVGEFNLVHPMADYKMLIFETYVKSVDGHKWRGRDFIFTQPFDYVSNQSARYYVDSALHNASGANYFGLHLVFHEKSIEVVTKLLISPIHQGIAISRIYGIK